MLSKLPLLGVIGSALLLGACFDSDDDENRLGNGNSSLNQPPTITGLPSTNVLQGQPYEFTPSASDPEGDALEFSVARKPAWARFDKATGRLSGTPDSEDVGNFTNIEISVSDGKSSADLPNFDISVNQIASGSATLSWMPPTENADGTPLTNLAGYRIYYGRNSSVMDQVVTLNNPGLTRYVVENLSTAKWYFAMTSVNANGTESSRSATASKTIG